MSGFLTINDVVSKNQAFYSQKNRTIYFTTRKDVVTTSVNVVLHEFGHVFDHMIGSTALNANALRSDKSVSFKKAFENEPHKSTPTIRETYAESFANFFTGNTTYRSENPNLVESVLGDIRSSGF